MNEFLHDKRVWFGVGALAILLLFGGAVRFLTKPSGNPASSLPSTSTSTNATSSQATSTATGTAGSPSKSGTAKSSLTYQQALAQYGDRRIQIQSGCQLSPTAPVFKNGTYVMFDNRTPTAQTISLDGARYTIGGYKFQIIRLYAVRLPHTIVIDCGAGRNNGQIILQG